MLDFDEIGSRLQLRLRWLLVRDCARARRTEEAHRVDHEVDGLRQRDGLNLSSH